MTMSVWASTPSGHQSEASNLDPSITARTPKSRSFPAWVEGCQCIHQREASKEHRMSAGQQARRAERAARQAADSGSIKSLGRVGLVAYGVVHLLVAYLAVRVALGGGVKAPYGTVLLLLVAAGLACFGIYCLFDARYRRG
jgi:hypothetical protein